MEGLEKAILEGWPKAVKKLNECVEPYCKYLFGLTVTVTDVLKPRALERMLFLNTYFSKHRH